MQEQNMKHTVLVLALLLMSAAPAWARQDSVAEQLTDQVQQRIEAIKGRLALTPEQIAQMRPVLEDEVRKLKAMREKYSGSDQSRRTKLKMARELRDIQSAADERLRKILSKQQMDEMKKIREERREQLRGRVNGVTNRTRG
jgi:hypothetical protein